MLQESAEFLPLISEAAVLIQGGRVCFANAQAQAILGEKCLGKSIGAVFGEEVAGAQASSYVGSIPIDGQQYIIRVARVKGGTAVFLSNAKEPPDLVSDAFICYLRSNLMSSAVALEMARNCAQKPHNAELLKQLACLSHDNYKNQRVIANASIVRAMFDDSLFVNKQDIDLALLLNMMVESLRQIYSGSELRVNDSPPVIVNADQSLIKQMLLNLISNCISHAKGCTRISMNLMECKDRAIISVDDDGCGMSQEQLHMAFDRYRHGYKLEELSAGAGFGLTATRYIAQLHGGALLIESREGKGTTARVSVCKGALQQRLREGRTEYQISSADILVGMADCLPDECFNEKFLD